jgi:iron complex outermembrane receptor protein
MHRFATLIIPFLISSSLYASEEDLFFDELPVVVSVTRLPQRVQDLPASVTVIDRQMIEASGTREVPDLLRLVAGFQVGHTSNFGPRISATYHGMSDQYSRRMQVLVDGRSVYMPATGGVDWFELPLSIEDIERIEVTRGPNGATYGANSFLGVINIITYHPGDIQGNTVKGEFGEGLYNKQLLRHAGNSGSFDYRVTLEHRGDDGYEDFTDSSGDVTSIKDNKSITNLSFRGDYRAGVNDYLTFQLGLNSSTLGDGVFSDPTTPEHNISVQRQFEQLKWKRVISTNQDIELNLYHIKSDSDGDYTIPKLSELFPYLGAPPYPDVNTIFGHSDDNLRIVHSILTERFDVELQHRFQPNSSLQMVWGAEARHDEVSSFGFTGSNSAIINRLYRLFANGEWQATDNWTINAGAMVERNDIVASKVSPRLALNYKLNDNHSIRGAYSVAYRTPAILEEYAEYGARFPDGQMVDLIWKSDGSLEPEEITAYEIGLVGETADRRILYDVRLFRERLRNLLATPIDQNFSEPYNRYIPPMPPPWDVPPWDTFHYCDIHNGFCAGTLFTNDGQADMEGLEIQLKIRPTRRSTISFGFSHVNASGEIPKYLNPTELQPLDLLTPEDTLSLLFDYTSKSQWQTSVGFYSVGNMQFLGGDETAGYTTADLRVAKHLNLDGSKGTLAFTVQNILGDYFDYLEVIPITQRAYLSAEFVF